MHLLYLIHLLYFLHLHYLIHQINLPYLHEGLHLKATLTRSEFEKISDVVMKRLVKPCENAMKDAGVSSSDIDKVILVGGSTRIPKVQDLCKKIFGRNKNTI